MYIWVYVEHETSSKLAYMQSGLIKTGSLFNCANVVTPFRGTLAQVACVGSTTKVLRIPDVRRTAYRVTENESQHLHSYS